MGRLIAADGNRQVIIIVTHNANLIINSDADQVHRRGRQRKPHGVENQPELNLKNERRTLTSPPFRFLQKSMEKLKPFEELANPDGRWRYFGVTAEYLYARAKKMSLEDSVPENVRTQYQQAQHLLVYSYFQYSLLSVAATQCLIALEAGLRAKWDLEPVHTKKNSKSEPGLTALLSIARNRGWTSETDDRFDFVVTELRNDLAHGGYMITPIDTLCMVEDWGKFIGQLWTSPQEAVSP
jgi:hypothetical protein